MEKTIAQKKAQTKYLSKGKLITVFFSENEKPIYDYLKQQAITCEIGVATYIKKIIEGDMYDKS